MRGSYLAAAAVAAAFLLLPATAAAELRFRPCGPDRCARLSVPLDHSGAVSGTLGLRVRRHPADEPPVRGTAVLLRGGPGAAGAGEPPYEWSFRMRSHDIVTLDVRGSGRGALRCRDLERATRTDAGREAAACAALLGERRGLFRATDIAEDVELLRSELGVERITLAGVGYGSFVAQRYLLRHPEHVDRMVLEDVVDADGRDPLYLDSAAAATRVLSDACRRGCAAFTRDPAGDTARLVARLASGPLRGSLFGPDGRRRPVALTRQELLYTFLVGDGDVISRSEYPAAVVSALRGDPAPLLRLNRRAATVWRRLPPSLVSPAADAAATCEETRFPWAWHASPAERDGAAAEAESRMAPALAAPFDPGTLVRSDLMRLCRHWPTASAGPPAAAGTMPDVPVLMLASPRSSLFPVETAQRAAGRYARAKVLLTAGTPWSPGCADRAVWRFVSDRPVPDRCPLGRPLVPASRPDPLDLRELRPVNGIPGRRGLLVRAIAATFGDIVDDYFARALFNPGALLSDQFAVRGGGLRGGSYALRERFFGMRRFEYVPGVRLSGRFVGIDDAGWGPLRVDGPGRLDAVVRVEESGDDGTLRVRGRVAGRRVRAKLRIPSALYGALAEETGGGSTRAGVVAALLRR